jgi:hypothetical protein
MCITIRRGRKNRIVKYTLLLLSLVLLTLYYPANAIAAETTTVSISAPTKVNPGETFTVSIEVTPGSEIAGIQFNLAFDASLITVDDVHEGGLLSQDGASTYFAPGIIGAGVVNGVVGVITTPGATVSGPGTFATVDFTAGLQWGTCLLSLSGVIVGDIDGQSVWVTVIDGQVAVNQFPVLNSIGDKSVDEGGLIEFTVSASDPDGDNLTYSASNLPPGASFDPQTSTFYWVPNYAQEGIYPDVVFQVSDGSLDDTETITITVNQPYSDWDTNSDGATNVLDMIRIGQHWGEVGQIGWIQEDANEDGTINVLDMIVIGQHWSG